MKFQHSAGNVFFAILISLALSGAAQSQKSSAPSAPKSAFTIEQVLSAPFPTNLVAAPARNRVAWVFNAQGRRNIWVAGPVERRLQITSDHFLHRRRRPGPRRTQLVSRRRNNRLHSRRRPGIHKQVRTQSPKFCRKPWNKPSGPSPSTGRHAPQNRRGPLTCRFSQGRQRRLHPEKSNLDCKTRWQHKARTINPRRWRRK